MVEILMELTAPWAPMVRVLLHLWRCDIVANRSNSSLKMVRRLPGGRDRLALERASQSIVSNIVVLCHADLFVMC